jgi:hypothetical protein
MLQNYEFARHRLLVRELACGRKIDDVNPRRVGISPRARAPLDGNRNDPDFGLSRELDRSDGIMNHHPGASTMKTGLRFLAVACLVARVLAAETGGFAIWKSQELKQRDQALSTKVGPDHSARETLADYGDHRFRLLYRDADGVPEQHDNVVDVVIVQSGEGTLLFGGKMISARASGGAGEYLGTGIDGGERRALAPGDVVHIPAKIPHSFLVPKGKHITYVLVKFPAA